MNIEGNGFSQMVQVMRKFGYNKDVSVNIGVVKSPLPDLIIKMEKTGLELTKSDLIVAGRLNSDETYVLNVGDRVIVLNDGSLFFILDKAVTF